MLICLVGPPQAGKNSLADHLVAQHGYERVHLGSSSPHLEPGSYASSSDFLDHATRTWRRNYVTTDLISKAKLVEFAKRPFVAIVAVDAPLGTRFKRAVAAGDMEPSLEDFVARDDLLYHGTLPSPAAPNDALARLDLAESDEQPATPSKAARLTPSSDAPPSPSSATITNGSSATSDCTHPAAVDDTTLAAILPLAHLTLPNPYPSLAPFLSSFSLPILSELLRPSWDTYFMLLASLASLRSNCMKRRVGAVLVREKRVVSTGYNGTPRGGDVFSNGDNGGGGERRPAAANGARNLSRIGEALDECLCLHAEENALLEAGRQRVSGGGTEGAVLYCNTCPCLRCTVKIVQCGVKEVIYSLSYSMDAASRRVMEEAGVVLRQIPQPAFPR
ncbi:hypothetical protein B0A53_00153 [Rhodotorula sp. CCFEE 5036]|nr:hypothetical protein B0A53_00153 [Rhodotorula sp. CCFEE 5036]